MSAYSRNPRSPAAPSAPSTKNTAKGPSDPEGVRIDGKGQILAMLEAADPAFRESLLRRLAMRDFDLAKDLRASLKYSR